MAFLWRRRSAFLWRSPHLAVHEHGEEPVAEGGEFLVLGAVAFDEVEEGDGGFVELLDEILF
jgi:hypothetical protein